MRVSITVDVEHDCPPFKETWRGITEGMPKLLRLLDEKNIKGTFFTTGQVAERYPEIVRTLVDQGHELGCHGQTHARFDKIDRAHAIKELETSTVVLRDFYPTISFRAPYLQFPKEYLSLLKELGYQIDSSRAKHKNPFIKTTSEMGIMRIPTSTTSLILRAPKTIRNFFLRRFKDPVVLFVHPWEFVNLQKEKLRFDCKYNTGEKALNGLGAAIDFYKNKKARFVKIEELMAI